MARVRKNAPSLDDASADLASEIARMAAMGVEPLRDLWRERRGGEPPAGLTKDLLLRNLCHHLQEQQLGALAKPLRRLLARTERKGFAPPARIKVGSLLVREFRGKVHEVLVVPGGFVWQGETYGSLSSIAQKITGTVWSGPRFFGLPAPVKNGERS
jgi:hypothetical protein